MRKLFTSALVALALTLGLGLGHGVGMPTASAAAARYLITNDGILQFTYYWDPYARAWVLIRVELYFPD